MSISGFFRKLFGRKKAEIPEEKRPEERYILCIDGGGMRGIVPVVMLQNLERAIRANGGNGDIAKYFDLVSGTSTGGLISLALTCDSSILHENLEDGSSQIDLNTLLETYMTMGKDIFQAKTSLFGLKHLVADKYSSEGIQNLCKRWFGMKHMNQAKVPTLIMAYNLSVGQPQMIRSFGEGADYPTWVAARATSAAPTYFSPIEYAGKLLVDGGVVANNPALYAYFEARKLYPECRCFHMISFSTGGVFHTMEKESAKGLISWADHIPSMFDTAQKRTTDYVLDSMPDLDYIRIDDPLPESIKMDETDKETLWHMKEIAENKAEEYRDTFDCFAKKLIENMEGRKNASETGRT